MVLNIRRSALVVGIVSALGTGFASPALAGCCGEVSAIGAAASAIVGAIGAATVSLTTVIQTGFATVVAATDINAKVQSSSQAALAEQQKNVAVTTAEYQQTVQNFKEYELAPNPCRTAGSATGAATAVYGAQQIGTRRASEIQRWASSATNGRDGMNTALEAFQDYAKKYSSGVYKDADISLGSLVNGAGNPGKPKDFTFSQDQEQAANRYIRNSISGGLLPGLPEDALSTPHGRRYLGTQRMFLARQGAAQNVFAESLAMRSPIAGLKDQLGQMWLAASKAITPSGNLPSGDISMLGFVTTEVDRRYADPNWYIQISQASPSAVAREQAYMQALQLRMQLMHFQQNEQTNLLLAHMLNTLLESSPAARNAIDLYNKALAAAQR